MLPCATHLYDIQDRLTQLGGIVYGFNDDGYLTSRDGDGFVYSTRGELVLATVGTEIVEYAYDGFNRIAARTDSAGTTQFFFGQPGNGYQITATKSPSGEITEYVYDHTGALFAFRRGGNWFYVASDQVGSPRAVIKQDGTVIKIREYDSYGQTLSDSAPSVDLPIGFAGGVQDEVTGLVRFGLRDYEPASGRWTARDPILFRGGQFNLFSYVFNNPVNLVDPSGTFGESVFEALYALFEGRSRGAGGPYDPEREGEYDYNSRWNKELKKTFWEDSHLAQRKKQLEKPLLVDIALGINSLFTEFPKTSWELWNSCGIVYHPPEKGPGFQVKTPHVVGNVLGAVYAAPGAMIQ